jgi:hypothetical protein
MTETSENAPSMLRLREGGIASLFLLGATVALLLITRTDVVKFAPQEPLYLVTAGLFAITIPGPIVRIWDVPAQLFFWNALGWGTGLMLFGLGSVGALPILPLILALFGLSFWSHEPGKNLPWEAISIVLIGGMLVCLLSWGDVEFSIPSNYTDLF